MYLSCSCKFLRALCYIVGLKDFCHVCLIIDKANVRFQAQNNPPDRMWRETLAKCLLLCFLHTWLVSTFLTDSPGGGDSSGRMKSNVRTGNSLLSSGYMLPWRRQRLETAVMIDQLVSWALKEFWLTPPSPVRRAGGGSVASLVRGGTTPLTVSILDRLPVRLLRSYSREFDAKRLFVYADSTGWPVIKYPYLSICQAQRQGQNQGQSCYSFLAAGDDKKKNVPRGFMILKGIP